MSDFESYSLVELRNFYYQKVEEAVSCGLPQDRFYHKPYFRSRDEALGHIETVESSIRAAKESMAAIAREEGNMTDNYETFEPVTSIINPGSMKLPENKSGVKVKSSISEDAIITVLVTENPKSRGAAVRFDFYYSGMTVREYIEKVGDKTKALADIKWDTDKGWISWSLATEQAA